ncbi:rhomboid family protein [Mesobacillus harenae]|uniref:rhomboid family protein n=1 Tax=Mesobacillus harenae TaxID=2213203 RepID=UPI0015801530|nr:rhomboid family intramembrane serine protease [Mesobacillus harenae]
MSFTEDYTFWRLADFFIKTKQYRILQVSKDQKELWLEKTEDKSAQIIRLFQYNLDWSNWLQRDIELTAANGDRIRKKLLKRQLKVMNIYVTPFPPVDDYEPIIAKPYQGPKGKVEVSSLIIAQSNIVAEHEKIARLFNETVSFTIQDEYTSEDVDRMKNSALTYALNKAKEEKSIFEFGKPFLTYVFIFIQIAMFLWLEMNGGSTNTSTLIKYGAKFNPLILEGEWWRFFTPIVLHIGLLHLLMNTIALFYLGPLVERLYGSGRFLLIYLFAGFSGSLASFIFSPHLSAGASGAIFGCFGALLYFGVIHPRLFFRTMGMNILIVIGINLVFGFTIPGIDNAGHIGGLAGGFAAAGVVHFPRKRRLLIQLLFTLGVAAIVSWSLSYGYGDTTKMVDRQSILVLAQQHIQEERYDDAYRLLTSYLEEENESEEVLFLLSFTEIKLGNLDEARSHLHKVIELDPEFHEAQYNLALVYLEQSNPDQALIYSKNAIQLEPDNKEYQDLLNRINGFLGEADGA